MQVGVVLIFFLSSTILFLSPSVLGDGPIQTAIPPKRAVKTKTISQPKSCVWHRHKEAKQNKTAITEGLVLVGRG